MQVKYSKISRFQIKKIMKCFSQDLTALQTAWLLGYNRNTINKYYNLFREIIYEYQNELYERLKMEWLVEVDESYFGAKRIRWYRWKLKRWRWTRKQPVFWILKRDGKVYTEIIPNCTWKVLQNIIESKVEQDTIIVSDWRKWYDWLVDMWYDKHYRVVHSNNEWSKWEGIHINWIENFRSFTKRRLNKFNWTKKNFHLHLKESEFRYWKPKLEIYNELIKLLQKHRF
jgi:transposase-like protein